MPQPRDRSALGWGRETTLGSAVVPTYYIPFTGDPAPVDNIKELLDQGVRANMGEDYAYLPGIRNSMFDFQGNVFPDTINPLLLPLLGDYAFAAATINTHTHSLLNSGSGQPPSCTLLDSNGLVSRAYPGNLVKEIQFKFVGDGLMEHSTKCVGFPPIATFSVTDGATTSASPTVTSATAGFTSAMLHLPITGAGIPANSFIGVVNSASSIGLSSSATTNTPVNATATGAGVTLTIGIQAAPVFSAVPAAQTWLGVLQIAGVTNVRFLGGDLTLARKETVALQNIDGSQAPYTVFSGPLGVTGKIEWYYEGDEAELKLYLNNTQPSADLLFTEPGAGALAKFIRFHMSVCAFKMGKTHRGKAFLDVETEIRGIMNATDAGTSGGQSPIKVTVGNTNATL